MIIFAYAFQPAPAPAGSVILREDSKKEDCTQIITTNHNGVAQILFCCSSTVSLILFY
ncbi:hypothetical protein PANT111_90062 [Pantoea brenneri]|uniref:Uncharacterized protein n=1 Tax=Pantoea brenneri TaxID=472694 RepID=A0AAX3JD38_9GAMM|nr:hypothetical protein PANT111_90062 [Pantoea brenneri]